jgi:phenylpropionate dioxygenase-like ring-hydroxylating dioxygenase large terminal subunit
VTASPEVPALPGTASLVQRVLRTEAQQQDVHPVFLTTSPPDGMSSDDLPIERYYSREQHDLEVKKVWRKVWQMACREDEIPNPGNTLVYDIVEDSVVLVRNEDGTIRGFINSCLHRGTELCVGRAHVSSLRCPFHGWSWKLDGSLKYIPCEWDFAHVDKSRFSLPEVKVGTWDGWVFVNLDPDAGPLEDFLENLPEHFEAFPLKDKAKVGHVVGIVDCNWKVAIEAFIESYHVQSTHPQLTPIFADTATQCDIYGPHVDRFLTLTGVPSPELGDFDDDEAVIETFTNYMLGRPELAAEIAEGEPARPVLAGLMRANVAEHTGLDTSKMSDAAALDAIMYTLFPNFCPWGSFTIPISYRFRPYGTDPERCIFELMVFAPVPEGAEKPPPAKPHHLTGTDWTEATELGRLGPIMNQDVRQMVRVQRGLKMSRRRGVTLANYQESRIRHLANTLDSYLNS